MLPTSTELSTYLKAHPIERKRNPDSRSFSVLLFTSNKQKIREYDEFLGKGYGTTMYYRDPPEVITELVVAQILAEMNPTPHYILREESKLVNAMSGTEISGEKIIAAPEDAPPFLYNQAHLRVWLPQWDKDSKLLDIITNQFEHKVLGSIDPKRKDMRHPEVFGWDHLFVNPNTRKTNQESVNSPWGKESARQLVLSDFVTAYLFYQKPKGLTFHRNLTPKQGVEFTHAMSVSRFMRTNAYFSNANLEVWDLRKMLAEIVNEGVFFKAGTSRPVNNYFSPPFGGIPLTAKKTDVEETVFMFHDAGHHKIPDLIFLGDDSPEMRYVYSAWRMMSEAVTMILADQLYADTLARTNPEWEKSLDQRIYPLFKATGFREIVEPGNREQLITKLLFANVQYAVLGNDGEWRKLIKQGEEPKLEAYKNHFGKFFIGDHVWTHANFTNMSKFRTYYTEWVNLVGRDQFKRARLILLDEVVVRLKQKGATLDSFKETVPHVFEEIIATRFFSKEPVEVISEEEKISRAFRRYMIGQLSFYPRFKELPGMWAKGVELSSKLAATEFFYAEVREEIYAQYVADVRYAWGMGCLTPSAAHNYMQVHPVFPPVYINYHKQECKTVSEVVEQLYGTP